MRVYNNCFTGTDAVDVILHYLLSDKDTFSTDLTREKAVKVCQLLLTKKVFEPVTSRHGNNTKHAFEDTSGKLYCFIETDSSENRENEPPIENDSDDDSLCDETDSHCTESRRGSLLMEPLSGKVGIIHPESKADHKSQASFCSLSSYSSLPSLSDFDSSNDSSGAVTKDVIEEVWREVALAQLTTLIDLTFLDGVLAEDKLSKRQQQHHNLIISNIVAKNWHLPITQSLINLNLVGLEEAEEDGVIQTAIACIECLPKGASLLTENNFQKNDDSTKQQAFELLHKHYSCLAETILPGRFFDLHMAILNLVLQRHDKQALEALRLDMILLPVTAKEELHRLLKFMTAVSLDTSLTLDSSDSNEVVVLRAFSNAIFKHKLLAPNLGSTLVQFMMQHLRKMFTVPYVIREKVSLRLYQIKSGQSLPEYDTTFCDRVSKEEFDRQARDCTQEALVNLMNNILDDTKLTLKEKKQKLKHFQKCYPTLYERHFSGMV
ncbi:hypothetical protein C0Q70_11371 [Pomacea canaliculata]|uniref:DEP domain-containing protein n=2 Tax=Pomacea canaliculata TaxID=400727 RepID=A0A2T7P5V0_POMCA|nr:hypothetical protein C0Q70_11371 [Pomacea canaliculata]